MTALCIYMWILIYQMSQRGDFPVLAEVITMLLPLWCIRPAYLLTNWKTDRSNSNQGDNSIDQDVLCVL